jgi:hypothetical protein
MKFFDHYNLNARLRPALLVLAPAGLGVAAWFPKMAIVWGPLTTVAAYCGLSFLLTQLGRDLGKQKEPNLFASWGGIPTTRQLRHATTSLDWVTLARCHTFLAQKTGVTAPTQQEELADPDGADKVYSGYTNYLREMTRDREKFPLVFSENVNYGFRRNLWAMKPAAILLSVGGIIASVGSMLVAHDETSLALGAGAAIACLIMLVWWCLRITPAWVRLAADAYADRLLGACNVLAEPPAAPTGPHSTV